MRRIGVRRIGYALGAEITGVDLREPLDDETFAEIAAAWADHIVLCFPGQDLGPAEMRAFCERFGELDDHRKSPMNRYPDHATVMQLANKPVLVDGKVVGDGRRSFAWHSDYSFTLRPSTGTFLLAKVLPDVGGNTIFANMYLAYETLSPKMQALLDPLTAMHDHSLSGNFSARFQDAAAQEENRRRNLPVVHPAVRVHPETGRKALFINPRVRKFIGMTEEESKPILNYLNEHALRYEFLYRHRWSLNDLVMWDNRCALHVAVPDYDQTQLRSMMRCTVLGPRTGEVYRPESERLEV